MNSERSKLQHRTEEEQQSAGIESSTASNSLEFASVEEMLRYDSEQNPVPPEVADRVNQSIAAEPKPKSWLKSLFGR